MVKPTLLKEFILGIAIEDFLNLFWIDSSFTYDFLTEQLNDIDVTISEWEILLSDTPNISGKRRQIVSFHPSKISFPGLPSHAESIKLQSLYVTNLDLDSKRFGKDKNYNDNQRIVIKETNNFKGIPYADFFSVNVEWIVLNSHNSSPSLPECIVSVYVDVSFHKSTWLQGTIESNTKAELASVYNLWLATASKLIEENRLNGIFNQTSCDIVEAESLHVESCNHDLSADVDIFGTVESSHLVIQRHSTIRKIARNTSTTERESFRNEENNNDWKDVSLSDDEEDDLDFYDCEEGSSEQLNSFDSNSVHTFRESESFELMSQIHMSDTDYPHMHQESTGPMTVHDIAVTVVETTFVFIEFSFWKIYNFYNNDLKLLFDITPRDVVVRFISSLLPGRHAALLVKPDLYGPFIALFLLPQAILLYMQTGDLGCSHSLLLCNALIVSLSLWLTLSLLYRILAYVLAPSIEFKQCLSVSGYSLLSWSLALTLSFLLEVGEENKSIAATFKLPTSLPLILLGLPAAIAQGCLFWEYTPFSSVVLRTLPRQMQRCRGFCSPIIQKILWIIPKFAAFIMVTGTHYEFLWYIVHIFVPGKKRSCRLSALMQPGQYADVLTQKELLKYTLLLLKGKKVPI